MATKTKAPAFGGLDRSKTLAENTVNAGPVVLDSNVTLKNPDGTGFQGCSLNVTLPNAGLSEHLSIAEVGGITLHTDPVTGETTVFYNGVQIGTEMLLNGGLGVKFDHPVSDAAATALARAFAYSTTTNQPSGTARAVTFTATDAEQSITTATMNITVKPENDAPVVSSLGPMSSQTPGSITSGFVIDGDAQVINPDSTGFKGGKLTVHLANATATDQLYLSDGPWTITGTKVYLYGNLVGTLSTNGAAGHDLVLTFKGNSFIPDEQMSALLHQVSYRSTASTPSTQPRDVTFTITDAEKSSVSTHVTLSFENHAPSILASSPDTGISVVSVGAVGQHANNLSSNPVVSPDGTEVAFLSTASSLLQVPTNVSIPAFSSQQVLVKNLHTGEVTLASSSATGDVGNQASTANIIFTQDGSKVEFYSKATNLVPGDTNGTSDIFVKDIATGAISRIDPNDPANQDIVNGFKAISSDGSKIVFGAVGDARGVGIGSAHSIFIQDVATGEVTFVCYGNVYNQNLAFSPDGTKIAFLSYPQDVSPGSTSGNMQLYVKDLETGQLTVESSDSAGHVGSSATTGAFSFSPDGTKIAFTSYSTNLVPGQGFNGIFIKDLQTGAITELAIDASTYSSRPVFTPDGAHLIFTSSDIGPTYGGSILMASLPATSVTSATLTEDAARKTLNAAGTFYFADADAKDTHAVSVAAPDGALGTLSAKVVSDMNGTGAVVWSYVVDETKVEPLAAGQTKVETFALTLDDHHGGTVTQNVTVTLTGTGGATPMVASFALAPESTAAAAPASGPELWASAMASLSGVSVAAPQLFDVLEKRAAALEAAHAHGPAGAFEGAGAEMAHLAAQIDPAVTHVLETLWSDLSGHGAGTATAHQIADGMEAIATHLRDALHAGHAGGPLLV
ncbi:VCBS domain-containing protein [Xanthobacter sp. YC-JY1]|uniref:VCBS domain-containing protein n=1 Tax=Xanthobacter sp. YC-JY1 TaxID=2419844 RepID=UPI001F1CD612|nr:VCBS domain-containing protein [Xanthobacter sp. YC-JY1]UJX47098.1 hypothetical protein D7006_21915 [Xanthobacter sp. YC-JY1]